MYASVASHQPPRRPFLFVIAFLFGILAASTVVADVEGITEPYRTVELASDESGSISEIFVEEGQKLKAGQPIARLDDRVQRLKVELAQHLAKSTSALEASKKAWQKRRDIAERIRKLIGKGHATESEIIRAEMELSIAKAKYLAAQEEAAGRQIELRRTEVELDRRTMTAPFDCVVAELLHDEGEFLSPLRPEIAKLVQVDQLLGVFPVPASYVDRLQLKQEVSVSFEDGPTVTGRIHAIGVTNDPESGTVTIKVKIDNQSGELRSGQRCLLKL